MDMNITQFDYQFHYLITQQRYLRIDQLIRFINYIEKQNRKNIFFTSNNIFLSNFLQ